MYINNNLIKLIEVNALSTSSFDSVLGKLNQNDVVYVGIAATATTGSCFADFQMDFAVQMFSINNVAASMAASNIVFANSVVATTPRVCEPTDVGALLSYDGQLQVFYLLDSVDTR